MKLTIILSTGVSLILTSCASRLTNDMLGVTAGAGLGNIISDGDPLMTAAGAAGGLLVGEAVSRSQEKQTKKSFTIGYDKGRSDAVKQQYWLLVDQQKKLDGTNDEVGLLEIPLPEVMPDGTRYQPGSTRTLRIGD